MSKRIVESRRMFKGTCQSLKKIKEDRRANSNSKASRNENLKQVREGKGR